MMLELCTSSHHHDEVPLETCSQKHLHHPFLDQCALTERVVDLMQQSSM